MPMLKQISMTMKLQQHPLSMSLQLAEDANATLLRTMMSEVIALQFARGYSPEISGATCECPFLSRIGLEKHRQNSERCLVVNILQH
jgi:hypothetical protein